MLWSGTDECYPRHMKVTPVDGISFRKTKNIDPKQKRKVAPAIRLNLSRVSLSHRGFPACFFGFSLLLACDPNCAL